MMALIDAHCHLTANELHDTLDYAITTARAAGIVAMVTNATSPEDWQAQTSVAARFPEVRFAWGIHPWWVNEDSRDAMARLRGAREAGAVAIGEIGLDGKIATPMELQEAVFAAQLDVAQELGLPVVIHARGAYDRIQRMLHERGPLEHGGIVHAFSASAQIAEDLMAHGLHVSMGAALAYKPSKKRRAVLDTVWPEYLLLETDSPDMAPPQARNVPNTPANLLYVLRGLLNYVDATPEEAAAVTTRNAARIFNMELP
ncbi:MAG: TatD family hydrolase [Candidatus Hydrogenedentota bacterium]